MKIDRFITCSHDENTIIDLKAILAIRLTGDNDICFMTHNSKVIFIKENINDPKEYFKLVVDKWKQLRC